MRITLCIAFKLAILATLISVAQVALAVELKKAPQCDKFNPIWARDGKWIAFNCEYESDKRHMYLIAPDGSQLKRVPGYEGTISDLPADHDFLFYTLDGQNASIARGNFSGDRKALTDSRNFNAFASFESIFALLTATYPKHADYWMERAEVQSELGNIGRAKKYAEAALRSQPRPDVAKAARDLLSSLK